MERDPVQRPTAEKLRAASVPPPALEHRFMTVTLAQEGKEKADFSCAVGEGGGRAH